MNNATPNNTGNDFPLGPSPATLSMGEEFLRTDLVELRRKYGEKKLFEKIFTPDENYYSVAGEFKNRRRQLIVSFWPPNQKITLSSPQQNSLLDLLAKLGPENTVQEVDANLKKISPNLSLPADLDLGQIQPAARDLTNVFQKINDLLLGNFAPDYLADTLGLYRLEETQFQNIRNQVGSMAQSIAAQLNQLIANPAAQVDENLLAQALELLGRLGRTKLFVSEEKNQQDLGQLSEIYNNIEIALEAAAALKQQNLAPENLNQAALAEIKKILQPAILM